MQQAQVQVNQLQSQLNEAQDECTKYMCSEYNLKATHKLEEKKLLSQCDSLVQITTRQSNELNALRVEIQQLVEFKERVTEKNLMCVAGCDGLADHALTCNHKLCEACLSNIAGPLDALMHEIGFVSVKCPVCRAESQMLKADWTAV